MSIKNDKPNYQKWRSNKKKYYISSKGRSKKTTLKSSSVNSFNNGKKLFTPSLKKKLLLFAGVVAAIGFLSLMVIFVWISRTLPDPNRLKDREIAQTTKIFDRTGEEVLYEIHGNEQRTLVSLDELPDYVPAATVSIEDKTFYEHSGISIWGIFRGVVWQAVRGKKIQGGSTLTQQFVKNSILTNERTVIRKVKEWILAYKLEKSYSKDEILQMYLNEIPYGSTAYGIEAASQRFFAKSAKDLSLAEAALLASLPQAPSRYSPYGSNLEILFGRQHSVLDAMAEQGYITQDEADIAKGQEIEFKKQSANIKAPHFVLLVKEMLSEKYGEKLVEQGGLKITTTLDMYKQEIAEEIITEQAPKNEEQYDANNAALLSIDPKTGQVLAMVGSKDYFNDEIDGQVNITTAQRQPGSSLKPLVYATTFLKGYTPNTVLYDVVTNFSNNDEEPYEPHNYDNEEHGLVSIRKALAGSLNTPAVKAIYLAGIDKVIDLAEELGYTTFGDRDRFGLSLVLGGGEVKMIEHVNAYSAFAREGVLSPLSMILRIEGPDGELIYEYENHEKKVLDPKVARQINDILSDNNARAYAFGERNWLTLGARPVAAKTGTTNDYRDAWTIGYTPSIVTGVWVGNNDNSEMRRGAAGGTVAAPIWHDYMDKVLGDTPIEEFKKPEIQETGKPVLDGTATMETNIKIDKASGLLATEYTPENFIEEISFAQPHSILYYIDRNSPLGDPPTDPAQDPQFELWESRILEWVEKEGLSTTTPPTEFDNLHLPENIPSLTIITPDENETLLEPFLNVKIDANAPRGINRLEYYVDGNLLFTNTSWPFNMAKRVDFLNNGFHNLRVVVCDDVDNCTTREQEFNLVLENQAQNTNVAFSFFSPINGLALSNIDFPLQLKTKVSDPALVAKINFYYKVDGEEGSTLIESIQPIENESINGTWSNIPDTGTYRVWGEVGTWSKEKIKSEEVVVTISNTSINEENIIE